MAERVHAHVGDAAALAALRALQRTRMLGRMLEGVPVVEGGEVTVRWLAGAPAIRFAAVEPPGAAVIAPSTAFELSPPPPPPPPSVASPGDGVDAWTLAVCAECGVDDALVRPLVSEVAAILSGEQRCGRPAGVLLHGPPGAGKSFLAQSIARHCGAAAAVRTVAPSDVHSRRAGDAEAMLQRLLLGDGDDDARAVVILDEMDVLLGRRASDAPSAALSVERRLADLLVDLLGRVARGARRVAVIAITSRIGDIDARLTRPAIFDRVAEVAQRTPADRARILAPLLRRAGISDVERASDALAEQTHGFVAADLVALIADGCARALRRGAALPSLEDFTAAVSSASPAVQRGAFAPLPRARARVTFADLGGLAAAIDELRAVAVYPFAAPFLRDAASERHARLARLLNVTPARGVLLAGPPGTGKTSLAAALAAESPLPVFFADAASLRSKIVGESERQLSALFAAARGAAPAILVIDQLDLVARARVGPDLSHGGVGDENDDGGGQGTSRRLTTLLLTELDGVLAGAGEPLVVVGVTARPDVVDPALLRPGRLELHVRLEAPDEAARADIFARVLRRTPVEPPLDEGGLRALARLADGMSGADIEAACREAALAALRSDIGAAAVPISLISDAVRATPPSLAAQLMQRRILPL